MTFSKNMKKSSLNELFFSFTYWQEFISIGILLPNDKLPSVRSLATDIGVNPNTVSKAYQELENQGYIYSIKGKGCFIADNQTDQLIKDDKLDDFKGCVNEMKKHQITKDKLLEIIEEVYKEETVWLKLKMWWNLLKIKMF